MNNRQQIEQTVRALYEEVLNKGQADVLSTLISGPYIQHNPLFPNGPEPLIGYLRQAGSIPCEI